MLVVAGRQQIQRQFQFTGREVSGRVICGDLILLEVFKNVKKSDRTEWGKDTSY
jgi:hypothetical protein